MLNPESFSTAQAIASKKGMNIERFVNELIMDYHERTQPRRGELTTVSGLLSAILEDAAKLGGRTGR